MGEAAFRLDDERMNVEIDVYSEHNFWSGVTNDLSEGGVFIATHKTMQVGETLIIDMTLPGEGEPIIALAEVRWTRIFSGDADCPPGLGLAFLQICEESLQKIRTFVRYRDPILFEI